VRFTCELLGIELDARKQGFLETLSVEQLAELVDRLESGRKWPDGL
jgi:hypothetical protein